MRRALAAIALTVVGMWLVLSFKSSPATRATSAAIAPTTRVPASPAAPGRQPPAAPPPPKSGATTTAPATSAATRTVTGNVVSTRYGNVQVAVVLQGTKIMDVKALELPSDRSRSRAISSEAAPLLHDEVMKAQSAQIDTVGGATATSDGYARSLQSALDKAHG